MQAREISLYKRLVVYGRRSFATQTTAASPTSTVRNVVVGMSGGVDSSVAAYLLKKQGFQVHGVYMTNWDAEEEASGRCTKDRDYEDVKYVSQVLGIPVKQVNFVKEYWNDVFDVFLKNYQYGLTPNPDILCNREIKFKAFLHHVRTELKMDAMATGHYARIKHTADGSMLLRGVDIMKDQSYFLSQVPSNALSQCLFPLGGMLKHEVKAMALDLGLQRIVEKPESMGICFIGKRRFPTFLSQYITTKRAEVVCLDTGRFIGHHDGLLSLTVGQGVRIGGQPSKYYVVEKDLIENKIYVVPGVEHHALYKKELLVGNVHFRIEYKDFMICQIQIRHGQVTETGTIQKLSHKMGEEEKYFVSLESPMRGIAPGQAVAFYNEEICIGGGTILPVTKNPIN